MVEGIRQLCCDHRALVFARVTAVTRCELGADDVRDADGHTVCSFRQAHGAARKFFARKARAFRRLDSDFVVTDLPLAVLTPSREVAFRLLTVAFAVHCHCDCVLFLLKSPLTCRDGNRAYR